MAKILAGRFETLRPAQRAARALLQAGFGSDDISIFHLNSPGQHHVLTLGGDEMADPEAKPARRTSILGAAIGALLLGVLGWLFGWYVVPAWDVLMGLVGACVGAYLGSLYGTIAGMAWKAARNRRRRPAADDSAYAPRKAGIVLAVHLPDQRREPATAAVGMLEKNGARDVEVTEGKWNRGWVDFDPVREPARLAERAGAGERY